LELQHKTILNINEVKAAYLQNLRIKKSENTITTKQYYSNTATTPEINQNQIQSST
jgi:hypothetical protein